jgi:hypothetical protein
MEANDLKTIIDKFVAKLTIELTEAFKRDGRISDLILTMNIIIILDYIETCLFSNLKAVFPLDLNPIHVPILNTYCEKLGYLVTGVQLGMILGFVKVNERQEIEKLVQEILDNQFVGIK